MILILENNCDFINGGSWTASEYFENGHPVLKVSNFGTDSISYADISYLSIDSSYKYKKNKLKIDDIVIATVGSHPSLVNSAAGRCIVIPRDAEGLLLNQNAVCLRSHDINLINQRYLGYLCKTQIFKHFIQQRGKGAANQMRIPISGIKSFKFDFPTIKSQKKIAKILSNYDDLIENNLKRIKLLEEKAQQTYEEWFVRMKFPNHENTPIDKTTGLPLGWQNVCLGELVTLQQGFALNKKSNHHISEEKTEFPLLKISDLFKEVETLFVKDTIPKQFLVDKHEIIYSRTGQVGHAFMWRKGVIYNNCFRVIPNEKIKNLLLFLILKSSRVVKTAKSLATGTAQPDLNHDAFKSIKTVLPPIAVQEQFYIQVIDCLPTAYNLKEQNKKLKEARDILLPRLMTGMIDVNKIEMQL